jgi:hypothetical protein
MAAGSVDPRAPWLARATSSQALVFLGLRKCDRGVVNCRLRDSGLPSERSSESSFPCLAFCLRLHSALLEAPWPVLDSDQGQGQRQRQRQGQASRGPQELGAVWLAPTRLDLAEAGLRVRAFSTEGGLECDATHHGSVM